MLPWSNEQRRLLKILKSNALQIITSIVCAKDKNDIAKSVG